MPVRIEEIAIQKCGPIDQLILKPKQVNLIYGKNEQGKTFLTEFIIRSLFKMPKLWDLRPDTGKGRVVVSGIDNKPLSFSPAASTKLDDLWEAPGIGLPSFLGKLLVVKGAELRLTSRSTDSVNKDVLKQYLSNQSVLDAITGRISATIQESRIEAGQITGAKKGEIRNLEAIQERVITFQKLLKRINEEYASGRISELETQFRDLKSKAKEMQMAKRYMAWQIHEEVQNIEQRINLLDEDAIRSVRERISLYHQKKQDIQHRLHEKEEADAEGKHVPWLQKAIALYQEHFENPPRMPLWFMPVLSICFLIAGVALTYFKFTIPGYIVFVLSVASLISFTISTHRQMKRQPRKEELDRLRDEFKQRFGRELTGLPDLEALLQEKQEPFESSKLLARQIEEEEVHLKHLASRITEYLFTLTGERPGEDVWDYSIKEIEQTLRELKHQQHDGHVRLAKLDVHESDFQSTPVHVVYSRQEDDDLQESLRHVQEEIQEEQQQFNALKQLVCQQTGDPITISWDQCIEHFRDKHYVIEKEYKQMTAEILGKQAVMQVLKTLRSEEDKKIAEGLKSDTIEAPLKMVTGHYERLEMQQDQLMVCDAYQSFPFTHLSTGTQEQILLAIRIGLSLKLVPKSIGPLFLVLDDAFQHSDWDRRKSLVKVVRRLAENGWQIFYFTMDDHIRKVFNEQFKSMQEYLEFELTTRPD